MANNGKIVAVASEGYETKQGCQQSITFVKANAASAPIEDLTAQQSAAGYGYGRW